MMRKKPWKNPIRSHKIPLNHHKIPYSYGFELGGYWVRPLRSRCEQQTALLGAVVPSVPGLFRLPTGRAASGSGTWGAASTADENSGLRWAMVGHVQEMEDVATKTISYSLYFGFRKVDEIWTLQPTFISMRMSWVENAFFCSGRNHGMAGVFSGFPQKNPPKLGDVFELASWPTADCWSWCKLVLRRCHDLVGSAWRIHEASLGFLSASVISFASVFGGKEFWLQATWKPRCNWRVAWHVATKEKHGATVTQYTLVVEWLRLQWQNCVKLSRWSFGSCSCWVVQLLNERNIKELRWCYLDLFGNNDRLWK